MWRPLGQLTVSAPRVLERGTLLPLLVSPSALSPSSGCTTIVVLGATSTSFVLDLYPAGASQAQSVDLPITSLVGGAEISHCGGEKAALSRLTLEMRSPRAVVRTLVLQSAKRPPSFVHALPHRDPGPFAPLIRSGPRPAPAPLVARIGAFEQRAALAGALESGRLELVADEDGAGIATVHLEEGCHDLALLSADSPGTPSDIDADVTSAATDDVIASDHSDAADASMSLCLGATTALHIRFAGAARLSTLALLHARYALPSGLPARWGIPARAHMAESLHAHALEKLGTGPVYESLGVQGATLLPVPAEPGACYVLGLALMHGQASVLGMAAESWNRNGQAQAAPGETATALALCAETDRIDVKIEVRGAGTAWMFAVWRTSRFSLGVPLP